MSAATMRDFTRNLMMYKEVARHASLGIRQVLQATDPLFCFGVQELVSLAAILPTLRVANQGFMQPSWAIQRERRGGLNEERRGYI